MKPVQILIASLVLTACKPSEVFGPDSRKEELLGGETAAGAAFASGIWEDGLGNAWALTVTGNSLAGEAASESLRGLSMTGTIAADVLSYSIGFPGEAPIAHGTARLTDGDHAQFSTLNTDGTLNAHGLLHFNHSAQIPLSRPVDLRPAVDCPNSTPQGD
jgi:hypothetical protein